MPDGIICGLHCAIAPPQIIEVERQAPTQVIERDRIIEQPVFVRPPVVVGPPVIIERPMHPPYHARPMPHGTGVGVGVGPGGVRVGVDVRR